MYKLRVLTLAVIASLISSSAYAAIAVCPDDQVLSRTYSVEVSDPATVSCEAYGEGNINGNNMNPLPGETLLDDTGETGDPFDGLLELTLIAETSTSLYYYWELTTALIGDFYLGFKTGTNLSPDWAIFEISGATSGYFWVTPKQGAGFSHGMVWGSTIPVPASLPLMLLGIAGLGVLHRRRRTV